MLPVLINAGEHVVKLSAGKFWPGVKGEKTPLTPGDVKRGKTFKLVNMGPPPFPANQALETSVALVFSAVT